ncbi:MAG TPA: F0F1 ATP synthase subunit delta [Methylophilaceae bacterium]|jgi:F-type H+-transporting ATPase subunit delta
MAEAITIARPYATAVFRLAKEKNALAEWSEQLGLLAGIASNVEISALIDDPKLGSTELEKIMLSICEGKLNAEATNLVKLMVENDRLTIMSDVAEAFEALKAQDEAKLEALLTAAEKPSEEQVQMLIKQLEARFGKKIEAQVEIDPELIGGIKIVVGDTVIDASVRGQLQELAYTLKG